MTHERIRLNSITLDLLESYRDGTLHTWGKAKSADRDLPAIDSEIAKLEAIEETYRERLIFLGRQLR